MIKTISLKTVLITIVLLLAFNGDAQELKKVLAAVPEIVSIEEENTKDFFTEKYVVFFRQPLDHKHPEKGTFDQRVIISHRGFENNTVFVTEGYGASYALRIGYENELSTILNANQIVCEHRYFLESFPKEVDYQYLTVKNAAADHHKVITALKKVYKQKWISTGISKGGQTTLFHRMLYPKDVTVSVPYVAPLNFSNYDKRHAHFLAENVGTKESRGKIEAFQHGLFKRREKLMPMFKSLCKQSGFSFTRPLDEIYDYCVLEYPFAFWQWGTNPQEIPNLTEDDNQLFLHFTTISSPSYFSKEGSKDILSFFIQAQRELGYYYYNPEPFKNELHIPNTENYLKKIFLHDQKMHFDYNDKLSRKADRFLKKKATRMLFVYGEWDPWSASGANIYNNKNIRKYVQKEGSHRARIKTLPKKEQEEVIDILYNWLQ